MEDNTNAPVDSVEQARIESLIDDTLGLPKAEAPAEEPKVPEAPAENQEGSETPEEPETPVEPEAPKDEPNEQPKPVEPAPELSYSFKDANGKEFTLKPGDSIDEVLADFEPANNGQIMKVLYDFQKLEAQAAEQSQAEQTKAAQEAEVQAAEARKQEQLTSWDNEIAALQQAGLIDAPKAKPNTAGWAKDAAVQKVDAVFQFMAEQNKERAEKGLAPLLSFGTALMAMNHRDEAKAKEDAIKRDNEAAKIKAGLVGSGGSPADNAPQPYVAGSAKTIWDV